MLPSIAACPRLLRLTLSFPALYDSVGEAFLLSECCARLQFFDLDYFLFTSFDRAIWDKAFVAMKSLSELIVSRVESVHGLFEAVVGAPALRLLSVKPNTNGHSFGNSSLPRAPAIESLLAQCSRLHFVLVLSSPTQTSDVQRLETQNDPGWVRLRAVFGERFFVQKESPATALLSAATLSDKNASKQADQHR